MTQTSVLLDTSFFIRLLNPEEKLHKNALGYYRYFLENDIVLKVSTIAIAEYCVRGDIFDLPLRNVMVLPFNISHSVKAGKMMAHVYEEKKRRELKCRNVQLFPMIPRCLHKRMWKMIFAIMPQQMPNAERYMIYSN